MAQIETGNEANMSNINKTSPKMEQTASNSRNLPVAISPAMARPSLHINKIPAKFLSQLIAERNHMEIQRTRRRAPVSLATRAYNRARHLVIRRMPTGFNYQSDA